MIEHCIFTNMSCHDGIVKRIQKHRANKEAILIAFGYQWKGNEKLFQAIEEIVASVISSLRKSKGKKYTYKVEFKKLEARGAGGVLCKICEDIQRSEIAIFDISDNNANVAFEMGLALGTGTKTVFIKNENKKDIHFSDLAGMAELRFKKTKKGIKFTNCNFSNVIRGSIVNARKIKETSQTRVGASP